MKMNKSVLIKNIYYMLSYAFSSLNQTSIEEIEKEEFDHIHNLFAAILAKGIGLQLKRGVYKEYLKKDENVVVMRGKINVDGTIKNKLAKKIMLDCEYDELSENNLLNQILKATSFLLIKHGDVDEVYKSDLKKKLLFFSEVDLIDLKSVKWSSIRFFRGNHSYRILISLCQLLVEGMLVTTEKGELKLEKFLDDQAMSRLYEKFILEYYIKEFPDLKAKSSQISWSLDDGIGTMLPNMQSDIMLSKGSNVLIIDAKYYSSTTQVHYDRHKIHSGNLYQIFTYVKNKGAEFKENTHSVSGLLLYAKTDQEIQPDGDYMMSGNRISVKTLDLNIEFKEIAKKLNQIAQSL